MNIQNRIVKYEVVNPTAIEKNLKNWRLHPQAQEDVMEAAFDEIGWISPLVVNLDNTLVDGHLRLKIALERGMKDIPVVFVNLNQEETSKALATHDFITGLADIDQGKFVALMTEIEFENASLDEVMSAQAAALQEEQDRMNRVTGKDEIEDFKEYDEDIKTKHTCPKCGHQWG